jgi:putative ABC transport system permease protein
VASVTTGLTLLAEHQQGIVPKIVATLKTQQKTYQIARNIPRPTAAQFAAMQACFAKLRGSSGSGSNGNNGSGSNRNGGGLGGGGNGGGGGGFGGRGVDRGAFAKCLPASLRKLRTQFTTPQQTLRQVLNPPQTNIQTTPYTIGGVDQTHPTQGLVTTSQVTKGRFLSPAGGHQALVSDSYAAKHSLKVGSKVDLNGTTFVVVGIVSPPLGGQTADVYLPLQQLQKLAGEKGLVNVALVRADQSSQVGAVQKAIESALPNAQVASSKQVADTISGSLVNASNLSHDLGFAVSAVAALAAFLLAALLALSSVGKRVRELGTLKALGWTQGKVVRQVAGESLATGVLGGIVGVALGLIGALIIDAYGEKLTASSTSGASSGVFGQLASAAQRTATSSVSLTAPVDVTVLAIGFALALLGGLIAGTAGAMRAARLRPADALRQVE